MSPILGIYASSISPVLNSGSYESIATVTIGSGGSSPVTFSSIPSTYTHLQIRGIVKASVNPGVTSYGDFTVRFNGDSGSNYTRHIIQGLGSTTSVGASTSQTSARIDAYSVSYSGDANMFGAFVLDIVDYANTSKYKTVRTLMGYDVNGSGRISLNSNLWMSTSAINSISISDDSGGAMTFAQYSSFALYGIKGS